MAPERAADSAEPVANGSGEDSAEQPSIWEILDELVGLDRASLTKALGIVLSFLLLMGGGLVYREVMLGRTQLALLYGGFILLVIGLMGSIVFVLTEADRLAEGTTGPSGSEAEPSGRGVELREKAE
mmetsp:Transcript_7432/g.15459  ORF Transcript_7432/g.15459 Transcript_7432/m.15459 type:complete len:127 (-) Transcript_7432:149-529(-)